jgi:hypothetical protein
VLASVYALRMFIRSMHNRVGPRVRSFDIKPLDGLVLVPLVGVIVFLALYPQLALHRSEGSVKTAVAPAQTALHPPPATLASRLPGANGEAAEGASGPADERAAGESEGAEGTGP